MPPSQEVRTELNDQADDPVFTSPARLNVAIITPDGDDFDSTNV